MKKRIIVLLVITVISKVALAESVEGKVIELFSGLCVYSSPAFEKMEPYAAINKWTELSEQESALLAPVEPGVFFKGWRFQDTGENYFAGYSIGESDGLRGKTCTLVSFRGKHENIIQKLKEANIITKQIHSETQGYQTYQIWNSKINGLSAVVTFITYKGNQGGVLSLFVKDS